MSKWVDDHTVAASKDSQNDLIKCVEKELTRPLTYYERTEHKIKTGNNPIQLEFDAIVEHAELNKMEINTTKTKNNGNKYVKKVLI